MAIGITPAVGNWYQGADQQQFEVVALDEDEGVIEIQYFDGELDEVEFDVWSQMGVEAIAPPEEWGAAYDDLERDDLGYTDLNLPPEASIFSLEDFEREE
ncbi:MAG TPA: hypothetical protein ENI97_08015 [Gammaproteobacteria bacterium]|nr:hypothetical protein [Gammaproteobacteria bacterium]